MSKARREVIAVIWSLAVFPVAAVCVFALDGWLWRTVVLFVWAAVWCLLCSWAFDHEDEPADG